jgi:hypothetical protein
MKLVPGDCGIQYLQSIVNVLSAIQTFVLSYEIVFPWGGDDPPQTHS